MVVVPGVGVLAAQAVQVRPGPLRAPQERPVIHKLPRFGILAVPLSLRPEWPDHLGMAVITALFDVKVAALELQGSIRLHALDCRHV